MSSDAPSLQRIGKMKDAISATMSGGLKSGGGPTSMAPLTVAMHKQESYCVCWSSAAKAVIVAGGGPFHMLCLDPITLKKMRSFKGHRNTVRAVVNDGLSGVHILSASADGTVRLWDAATSQQRAIYRTDNMFEQNCVIPFHGGSSVCAAGGDMTVRLWDTETQRETLAIPIGVESLAVLSLSRSSLSPDIVFVGCKSSALYMYDTRAAPDAARVCKMDGHDAAISTLAMNDESQPSLYSGSYDGSVRKWKESEMGSISPVSVIVGIKGLVRSVVVRDSLVAVCSISRSLRVVSALTDARVTHLDHLGWVNGCAFSGDGKKLYTACSNSQVYAWDADAVRELVPSADEFASVDGFTPPPLRRRRSVVVPAALMEVAPSPNFYSSVTPLPREVVTTDGDTTPANNNTPQAQCLTTCDCKQQLDDALHRIAELEIKLMGSAVFHPSSFQHNSLVRRKSPEEIGGRRKSPVGQDGKRKSSVVVFFPGK